MNFESQDKQFKIAELTKRGFLDIQMLFKYKEKYQKDLLLTLRDIVKMRKGSGQNSLISIVSLQISELKGKDVGQLIESLNSQRKTLKTRSLANLLVPNPQYRNQIQKIRSMLIKQIRLNEKFNVSDVELVLELYQLLNIEVDFEQSDIQYFLNGQKLKEFKQKLTSLKKMIGDAPKLEEQEKQEKKKAYLKNLQFRQIMEDVAISIKDPELQKKLQQILEIPKNKKWIGCRFHKLLIQNKWSVQQISIFSDALKQYMHQQLNQKQIKMKKIKSSIKLLLKNLKPLISKIEIPEENARETKEKQNSRMVNQDSLSEVESLISLDCSSYSLHELKIFQEEEQWDNEGDQLII